MLTHGTKRAEIDFMVFLTIFEYAESNAEWCQAQLFMQRLEFYDLCWPRKSLNKNTDEGAKRSLIQYTAHICLLYIF